MSVDEADSDAVLFVVSKLSVALISPIRGRLPFFSLLSIVCEKNLPLGGCFVRNDAGDMPGLVNKKLVK